MHIHKFIFSAAVLQLLLRVDYIQPRRRSSQKFPAVWKPCQSSRVHSWMQNRNMFLVS